MKSISKKYLFPLVATIISVIYLLPLLYMVHSSFLPDDMVIRSFKDNAFPLDFTLQNYKDVFDRFEKMLEKEITKQPNHH